MINEHIISIESNSNSFNTTCNFNTKMHFQKDKYCWTEMFKMNDIIVKKTQNKQQVEQPFVKRWKKHYPTFEFLYLHQYYLQYIFVW